MERSLLNDCLPQNTSTHSNSCFCYPIQHVFIFSAPFLKSLSFYPLFVVLFLLFMFIYLFPCCCALKPRFHVLLLLLDLKEGSTEGEEGTMELSYLLTVFSSPVLIVSHFFHLLSSHFLFFWLLFPLRCPPILFLFHPSAPFFPPA